jgi:AraC-like DNA-binding protein
VGLRTGFSHQSHFTRLFRKLTGTTPHTYRLAARPEQV